MDRSEQNQRNSSVATKRQGGSEVEENHWKDDEKHRGDVTGNALIHHDFTVTHHDPWRCHVCKMRKKSLLAMLHIRSCETMSADEWYWMNLCQLLAHMPSPTNWK